MWQYRGVISMFFICQRNEESMIKQWHTLYGYAVHPEKVSWTSPCRVSSSFSSSISSSLSTTRPRMGEPYSMNTTNLESPGIYAIPISGEERERKQFVVAVEDGYIGSWLCALPVSLSCCSYLLHCFLNLIGLLRLVNMKTDWTRLLT